MKHRFTSAPSHSLLQRLHPVVASAMGLVPETFTGIICGFPESRNWESILGGLYRDPTLQSGRCLFAPP